MDLEQKNKLEKDVVDKVEKDQRKWLLIAAILFSVLGGLAGSYITMQFIPQGDMTSRNGNITLREESLIIDVADEVSPSVVSIISETTNVDFFGFEDSSKGAGTGVIISDDGLILTNKHVLPSSDSGTVRVMTSDGSEYTDVEIVARDPFNDVAFLRLNNPENLKPARLGDSNQVQVGQKVVAIGNALGRFNNTVTSGIISGIGRPVVAGGSGDADALTNLFQTDAAINPGNSGGPLLNLHGEVIGINTAVAGNSENIGFAIPINDVKFGIESIVKEGRFIRPYLGVRYVPVTNEVANENNLSVNKGAYLPDDPSSILEGGPADKAGLKPGDVITEVAGESIDSRNGLGTLISQQSIGEKVTLTIIRNGKELEVKVILEESPAN